VSERREGDELIYMYEFTMLVKPFELSLVDCLGRCWLRRRAE
jgi:hypothetical protein